MTSDWHATGAAPSVERIEETMGVRERLIELGGDRMVKGSMINHGHNVEVVLSLIKPGTIVEIGTLNGMSAAFWAHYCQAVITIDIQKSHKAFEFWRRAGVAEKISAEIVVDDVAKSRLLDRLTFDFAFIDGEHTGSGVALDFGAVRKARAVLFHDYKPDTGLYASCTNDRFPDVANFIDTLDPPAIIFGPKCSKMALWLNPDHYNTDDYATALSALGDLA